MGIVDSLPPRPLIWSDLATLQEHDQVRFIGGVHSVQIDGRTHFYTAIIILQKKAYGLSLTESGWTTSISVTTDPSHDSVEEVQDLILQNVALEEFADKPAAGSKDGGIS